MRKKPTVAQKTYCPGKKTAMRDLEISNGEIDASLTTSATGPKLCKNENVNEEVIHRVFIEAWNTIVREQETIERRWDRQEKEGIKLERLWARQKRELVQTVLENIMVKGNGAFEIRFLNGTSFQIKL